MSVVDMVLPFRSAEGNAIAHIPGEGGWPIVGQTIEILADPKGFVEKQAAKHGLIFRNRSLGQRKVTLLGPDANEFVLLDHKKQFSSSLGWGPIVGTVFPRGLMLLDFDEHRLHRKALSVAFRSEPMRSYLSAMNATIGARVAKWRTSPGTMPFHAAIKQLTLDLAATSFLGSPINEEIDGVREAFVDMVAATIAPVRKPLPGTKMRRGLKGRAHVASYFRRQIPIRRDLGGDDLFSQLCMATDEDGAMLSIEDVVDHMTFLMMAAHDTLTSSLTSFVWMLIDNPDWQERLREEIAALNLCVGEPLQFEKLDAMPLTEMAFKETMRIMPPLPCILRRAVSDFEFGGYRVPAGTNVNINPLFTHHMPEIWPNPARFDPFRFTDEAQRTRHRFAWVPLGGGAHMCLGANFAYMQAKCFARHLLQNLKLSAAPGYRPEWRVWPIPQPKDGLPIAIAPIM